MKKSMRFLLLLLLPILLISCSKDGKVGPLGPGGERGTDGGDGGTIIITNNNYYTNGGPSGSTNTIQIRHTLIFDILMDEASPAFGQHTDVNIKAESEVELYQEQRSNVWRCIQNMYVIIGDGHIRLCEESTPYIYSNATIKTILTWWEDMVIIVP